MLAMLLNDDWGVPFAKRDTEVFHFKWLGVRPTCTSGRLSVSRTSKEFQIFIIPTNHIF